MHSSSGSNLGSCESVKVDGVHSSRTSTEGFKPSHSHERLHMKARLLTRQWRANEAAVSWNRTYPVGKPDPIGAALTALGLTPDPDEVDRVIGNKWWTQQRCDACDKYAGDVVVVGDEPDYESRTATLCRDCITEAYNLIKDIT